jgi:IS66 Orf2 like protein.
MLEDYFQIKKCVLCCGAVDLRKGIDGLAQIVGDHYKLNPFERGTLFVFCGRRTDRVKALLWMGNGFILMYHRYESGHLDWPRTPSEAAEIDEEQFRDLVIKGLNPLSPKIKDVFPSKVY